MDPIFNSIFPQFFEANTYVIDERVGMFKFTNNYKVYNDQGQPVGEVRQKLSGGQKALRLLLNKAMLPFHMNIMNLDGDIQATIKRGWTFFMSKIQILDSQGDVIGKINQKFKFFKPTFNIYNNEDRLIATITGDWKAWNFAIQDANNNQIGTINKKWNGAMKEFFTTADKYVVNIVPEFAEDINKIAIVSTAITIDMVLKETK